jgi:hypothetical protein
MKGWINWGHRIEEIQISHPVGSKRRWILVLSHNNVNRSSWNVFSHGDSFQIYFMRIVNQAVKNGVSNVQLIMG